MCQIKRCTFIHLNGDKCKGINCKGVKVSHKNFWSKKDTRDLPCPSSQDISDKVEEQIFLSLSTYNYIYTNMRNENFVSILLGMKKIMKNKIIVKNCSCEAKFMESEKRYDFFGCSCSYSIKMNIKHLAEDTCEKSFIFIFLLIQNLTSDVCKNFQHLKNFRSTFMKENKARVYFVLNETNKKYVQFVKKDVSVYHI